jgi:hypothetical protein
MGFGTDVNSVRPGLFLFEYSAAFIVFRKDILMTRFLFCVIFSSLIIAGSARPAFAAEAAGNQPVPMDSAALAAASGGSEASVDSTVSQNAIGNVGYTGGIANVSASGNSGLTTLIENTGNQVSIATSTVVNVNFH